MSTLFNHQLVFSGLCDEYHLLKVSLHNTINSGAKMMGIHSSPVFGGVFQEDIPRNNRGVFSHLLRWDEGRPFMNLRSHRRRMGHELCKCGVF